MAKSKKPDSRPKAPKPSALTRQQRLEVVSKNLLRILAKKGWTRSYWAARSGLGRAEVTNYINKVSVPGWHNANELAKAADVPLADICPFYDDVAPGKDGTLNWFLSEDKPGYGRLEVKQEVSIELGMQIVKLIQAENKSTKA